MRGFPARQVRDAVVQRYVRCGSEIGVITLVDSAILTTIFSPLTNKLFSLLIHYEFHGLETYARAFNCRSVTKSISSM